MNGKSACAVDVQPSARAVQDEWGMFDPNQAGLEAAFRAVRALDDPAPISHRAEPRAAGPTRIVPHLAPPDETPYDLSEPGPRPQPAPKPAERGAVYTLEFPTRCPQCSTEITTVRVSRLLRTQVSFTSTLPRKGYIIVCPECDGILSAELSGLI